MSKHSTDSLELHPSIVENYDKVLDLMTLLNHVRHLAIGRESNSASLELVEQSIPEGAQTIQAWLQRNRNNAKDAAHDEKTRCG